MVRVLLAHGTNVNTQNTRGETALHCTLIYTRDRDTIGQLLAHGADLNRANKRGQTPLILAQQTHRPDLVALLTQGAK